MQSPSGLFKAGTILLLVGAILHAVGAFFLLAGGLLLLTIGSTLVGEGETTFPATVVGSIYLGVGLVLAVGTVVGFQAWRRAQAGDARSAWVRGLVSSLLPPLQVVTLVGAILCLVSPEGEEQGRAQAR